MKKQNKKQMLSIKSAIKAGQSCIDAINAKNAAYAQLIAGEITYAEYKPYVDAVWTCSQT